MGRIVSSVFFSEFQDLSKMYKGKGERSIEDSAKLVGLGLPTNNKDPTT